MEGKEFEEINENDSNEKEKENEKSNIEEEKIITQENNNKPQQLEMANQEWNFNFTTQNSDDESPFLDAYKNFYQTKFDKFLENAIFHEYVIPK